MKNLFISKGNKKLAKNDNEYFLIWSLPAEKTCPYATDMCRKFCYAKKSERIYPQVLPCRENNLLHSLQNDFVDNMVAEIQKMTSTRGNKDKKCYFRIHESGDFYSLTYTKKWIEIAKQLPHINFLAYTKSIPYIKELIDEIPTNMVVRSSLWADTKREYINMTNELSLPIYTAFDKTNLQDKVENCGYKECLCDCKVCKDCYKKDTNKLAVAIH